MSEHIWRDRHGQEYYFDYPIGDKMKESEQKSIEEMDLIHLKVLRDLLHLEEHDGADATEYLDKVQDEINNRTPYAGATKEELLNLRLQMHSLEEEGIDMSASSEILDKEIKSRSESGIIYESDDKRR